MKILLKLVFLSIVFIIVFNFLEFGFKWERIEHYILPIILTAITLSIYLKSNMRKFYIVISFCILGFSVLIYLLDELNLANLVCSFGFAVLFITIISYLPESIKKGYIEKL